MMRYHCSRMRERRPQLQRETEEEWCARALRNHARRNDPPLTLPSGVPDFSAIFMMDYDVLDDPEHRAFSAWLNSRDEAYLWSVSYEVRPYGEPEGLYRAKKATPTGIECYTARSWRGLRTEIESARLSHP